MSVEQHAEAAAEEVDRSMTDGPVTIIAKHMQAAIDEATATNEYAYVGAMLARCENAEIRKRNTDWIAWVRLKVGGRLFAETGPTQLAAIRAAVKAAEKGVQS